MPPAGLEPALCFQKGILSPSCLPISPQWHRKELPIYDSSYNTIETVLCQELLLDFAAVQLRVHAGAALCHSRGHVDIVLVGALNA